MKFRNISLMLVPDSGKVHRMRISAFALRLACLGMVCLLVFGAWGSYSVYQSLSLEHQHAALQDKAAAATAEYRQEIDRLKEPIEADRQRMAVLARNIGQVQARLTRLDALGSRLVQVASLDKSEFDFTAPPAFGGPRVDISPFLDVVELDSSMQSLNMHLARVDAQLTTIDYLLEQDRGEKAAKPNIWPSEGGWLSSVYGHRADPFTGEKAMHRGVDIANRFGASALAASRGVVVFAGRVKDFGYMVEVSHGYGYRTRYGHLSKLSVKAGDEVYSGEVLGHIGSSGRSTGPHLHYEVHRHNRHLNPYKFLPRG